MDDADDDYAEKKKKKKKKKKKEEEEEEEEDIYAPCTEPPHKKLLASYGLGSQNVIELKVPSVCQFHVR
nr:unnamed protein product [Spirometra erinaceieuropaei]